MTVGSIRRGYSITCVNAVGVEQSFGSYLQCPFIEVDCRHKLSVGSHTDLSKAYSSSQTSFMLFSANSAISGHQQDQPKNTIPTGCFATRSISSKNRRGTFVYLLKILQTAKHTSDQQSIVLPEGMFSIWIYIPDQDWLPAKCTHTLAPYSTPRSDQFQLFRDDPTDLLRND